MTPRPRLLLVSLIVTALLAGCGTPDEQEADESPQSEQESVGEGEVPGPGVVLTLVAGAFAVAFVAWRQR